MASPENPRPISSAERALLLRVLAEDFPGNKALVAQVDDAEVVRTWGYGGLSVDLRVTGDHVPAEPSGLVPVRALAEAAGEPVGELLVWVKDGMLDSLEYAWYGLDDPTALPGAEQIVVGDQ